MQIKMLETKDGADDGVNIRAYDAGETYEVSDVLANAFIGDGVAAPATENEPAEDAGGPPETGTEPGAPSPKPKPRAKRKAKDAGAPPENKAG